MVVVKISAPIVVAYYPYKKACLGGYSVDLAMIDATRATVSWHDTRFSVARKSILGVIWTPVHLVALIAYHALRMVYVIFLVLLSPKSWQKEAGYIPKKIFTEVGRSLLEIARAPFFAVALIVAHAVAFLLSLFTPYSKRLPAAVEAAWNHNIPIGDSVWIVRPGYKDCFNAFIDPDALGAFSLYFHGCYQEFTTATLTFTSHSNGTTTLTGINIHSRDRINVHPASHVYENGAWRLLPTAPHTPPYEPSDPFTDFFHDYELFCNARPV